MGEQMNTTIVVLRRLVFNGFPCPLLLAGLLITLLVLMLYRRYATPLSNIPGPFWASVSRLWHTKMILRGNQGEELLQLHQEYGKYLHLRRR